MKFLRASVAAIALQAASARFLEESETEGRNVVLHPELAEAETYLIELAPGETKWVTEEEKWELRRVGYSPSAS
jgi:bacterial leucyl aminopeptidase